MATDQTPPQPDAQVAYIDDHLIGADDLHRDYPEAENALKELVAEVRRVRTPPVPPERAMTERFQCPGCTLGGDTTCGAYKQNPDTGACAAHRLGTIKSLCGPFALGLPKGFCRPGVDRDRNGDWCEPRFAMPIRFFTAGGRQPLWDKLNIPVWAMEDDGYLIVRTVEPRHGMLWT